MTRLLYLGNNWVGWRALEWLRETGQKIVGLVVHPGSRARHRDDIIRASGLSQDRVFDASCLDQTEVANAIFGLGPDLALSVYFGYILRPGFLQRVPRGVVNLHPAYLPYNRGANPNVWSIVDRTPAGVTLHWVDETVDTGDIIARRELPVDPVDTGGTLYHKLERAALDLLREAWPAVVAGTASRTPQEPGGTFHRVADLERLDRIDLDRTYTARQIMDILRARTFPPYRGACFEAGGRRVFVTVRLEYAANDEDDG
jgi:methionyl-tRNA formyltransferase